MNKMTREKGSDINESDVLRGMKCYLKRKD